MSTETPKKGNEGMWFFIMLGGMFIFCVAIAALAIQAGEESAAKRKANPPEVEVFTVTPAGEGPVRVYDVWDKKTGRDWLIFTHHGRMVVVPRAGKNAISYDDNGGWVLPVPEAPQP